MKLTVANAGKLVLAALVVLSFHSFANKPIKTEVQPALKIQSVVKEFPQPTITPQSPLTDREKLIARLQADRVDLMGVVSDSKAKYDSAFEGLEDIFRVCLQRGHSQDECVAWAMGNDKMTPIGMHVVNLEKAHEAAVANEAAVAKRISDLNPTQVELDRIGMSQTSCDISDCD